MVEGQSNGENDKKDRKRRKSDIMLMFDKIGETDMVDKRRKLDYDRLTGFKMPPWYGDVAPRVLAEHGWRAIAKDTVKCDQCGKIIVTTVPRVTEVPLKVYSVTLRHIRDMIMKGHEPTCTMITGINFFPDIDNLPLMKKQLNERAQSLCNIKLPQSITIEHTGEEEELRSVFVDQSIDIRCMILAAAGWKADSLNVFMECDLCMRSVLIRHDIDPSGEHHRWCPIVDQINQQPYWKYILDLISKHTVRDTNGVRRILYRSLSIDSLASFDPV